MNNSCSYPLMFRRKFRKRGGGGNTASVSTSSSYRYDGSSTDAYLLDGDASASRSADELPVDVDELTRLFQKSIKERDQAITEKRAAIKRLKSENENLQRKRKNCIIEFCRRDLDASSLRDLPGVVDSLNNAHRRQIDTLASENKTSKMIIRELKQMLEEDRRELIKITIEKEDLEQNLKDILDEKGLRRESDEYEGWNFYNLFSRLFCLRSRNQQ